MQGGASRFLCLTGLRIKAGSLAMDPIVLHLARINVFGRGIAKEWQEVDADVNRLRFYISLIALALRDNFELIEKYFGGILETRTSWRSAQAAIGRLAKSGCRFDDLRLERI